MPTPDATNTGNGPLFSNHATDHQLGDLVPLGHDLRRFLRIPPLAGAGSLERDENVLVPVVHEGMPCGLIAVSPARRALTRLAPGAPRRLTKWRLRRRWLAVRCSNLWSRASASATRCRDYSMSSTCSPKRSAYPAVRACGPRTKLLALVLTRTSGKAPCSDPITLSRLGPCTDTALLSLQIMRLPVVLHRPLTQPMHHFPCLLRDFARGRSLITSPKHANHPESMHPEPFPRRYRQTECYLW